MVVEERFDTSKEKNPVRNVGITTDFIRLDQALKLSGVVQTGGQAKLLIQAGRVKVDGVVETHRGRKIYDQAVIDVDGREVFRIVRSVSGN